MDKPLFVKNLKKSLDQHFKAIVEQEELLSFGIYTDGDASTIGMYYNTKEHYLKMLKASEEEGINDPLYFLFFMEEWKKDISIALRDDQLDKLNYEIAEFGTAAYKNGNEYYKDEVFDLFTEALVAFKNGLASGRPQSDFFVHLEVSDHWVDEKMLKRISRLHNKARFVEYEKYVEENE